MNYLPHLSTPEQKNNNIEMKPFQRKREREEKMPFCRRCRCLPSLQRNLYAPSEYYTFHILYEQRSNTFNYMDIKHAYACVCM